MPRLSISAYARHRGISHVAVLKAIKNGRIVKEVDGTIDTAKADALWGRNTREQVSETAVINAVPAPVSNAPAPAANGPTYAQSRAVKEAYLARLAKLTFEEKSGQVVRIDNVKVAWFNVLRILRDQALNLPDRLAPIMAAETEPRAVRDLLEQEIRQILEDAANNMATIKTE